MAFIKKNQKTQDSNHTCVCLCSHSGAVEDYGVMRSGIDLGSRQFSWERLEGSTKKHYSPWGSPGSPPALLKQATPLLLHCIGVQSVRVPVCTS